MSTESQVRQEITLSAEATWSGLTAETHVKEVIQLFDSYQQFGIVLNWERLCVHSLVFVSYKPKLRNYEQRTFSPSVPGSQSHWERWPWLTWELPLALCGCGFCGSLEVMWAFSISEQRDSAWSFDFTKVSQRISNWTQCKTEKKEFWKHLDEYGVAGEARDHFVSRGNMKWPYCRNTCQGSNSTLRFRSAVRHRSKLGETLRSFSCLCRHGSPAYVLSVSEIMYLSVLDRSLFNVGHPIPRRKPNNWPSCLPALDILNPASPSHEKGEPTRGCVCPKFR